MTGLPILEAAIATLALAVALAFQPWAVLRAPALRAPYAGAIILLALAWAAQSGLPASLPVVVSGACLLVLMFGWPLAIVTVLAIAGAAWARGAGFAPALALAAWSGVLPATLALAIGIATRRWLPRNLFVYILGRAFLGTALAVATSAVLRVAWLRLDGPVGELPLLTAGWLVAWADAFLTGGLTAIFVAFRPQWLLTWSDDRYLPRASP